MWRQAKVCGHSDPPLALVAAGHSCEVSILLASSAAASTLLKHRFFHPLKITSRIVITYGIGVIIGLTGRISCRQRAALPTDLLTIASMGPVSERRRCVSDCSTVWFEGEHRFL